MSDQHWTPSVEDLNVMHREEVARSHNLICHVIQAMHHLDNGDPTSAYTELEAALDQAAREE